MSGGIWRAEPAMRFHQRNRQENSTKRIPERRERSRRLEVFLSSAATLREVKVRKTPSASSYVGGVFHYGADACRHTRSRAMRSGGSDHRIAQEPTRPLGSYLWGKVCHARMDGNSDQCDRLCRLRRCRDVSPIARSPIRQKISGPLSAAPPGVSSPCAVDPQYGPVCRP
jgi:hypothetical protein